MAKKVNSNTYENGDVTAIGGNSVAFTHGDLVSKSGGFLIKSVAGGVIEGVSKMDITMDSDNQTVAKEEVVYEEPKDSTTYDIPLSGITLTFAGALVTSNTVDMDVNGVALDTVTFTDDDATTLGLIATALEALSSIDSATAGTHSIVIVPAGESSTVVITDIVVAAGATQTTGSVANATIAQTDEGKYYDITSGQAVDVSSASASTGQLQLVKYLSSSKGLFTIVNL